MNRNTKIEWTDMTWNPIIGCHKISPGCKNCYAEKMANRISHMNTWIGEQYRKVIGPDGEWNWDTVVSDSHMDFPKIKKPKKVFVGSMTDIFLHSQSKQGREDVIQLFGIMAINPQHTFQILTKRPTEMKIFIDEGVQVLKNLGGWFGSWPLPNVWLGVTVCNQDEANFKIPILLDTPASKRFISIEPILGPIKLPIVKCADWIIIGAETGQKARPIQHSWVANIVIQAELRGIPVFFKSWGKNDIHDSKIESLKQFPKQ